uniref:Uncharacterized protein n=1 Tax=Arundo donax TaxID=35708 RepID=A0A0A9CK53_ARUDO
MITTGGRMTTFRSEGGPGRRIGGRAMSHLVRRRGWHRRVPAPNLVVGVVLRLVQRGVQDDEHEPDEQRGEDVGGGVGEQQESERDDGEHGEDDAVADDAAEEDEWLVAEEVEDEPGEHADEEDDEGDGVPEQGEEDDDEDDDGVVHGEVGEVGAHAEVRVAEAGGQAYRVDVPELAPGPARRQRGGAPGLGAGDEVEGGGAPGGRPARGGGGGDGAVLGHGRRRRGAGFVGG